MGNGEWGMGNSPCLAYCYIVLPVFSIISAFLNRLTKKMGPQTRPGNPVWPRGSVKKPGFFKKPGF
jgi:hypothetical protein